MDSNITVYGAYWCPDCRRSKRFLSEQQIAYQWVDIEQDEAAKAQVEEMNNGKRIIPTIVFEDGSFLVEPTNADLAKKLGLTTKAKHDFYDVLIIGAGPAGLTTAIYNARDGYKVLVVDEGALGGQASTTESLDNYPGFPDGIGGKEWSQRVVQQALRFGVEFLQAQTVVGIRQAPNGLWVKMGDGEEYGSCSVVIATGADYRHLGVEGEEEFIGAGVHFCSTCDGPFYKDKHVMVVGGGYSATEEAFALLRFVTEVTMLVRGDKLKVSKLLADKAAAEKRIKIRYNTVITKLGGENKLQGVHIKNNATGEEEVVSPDGLFVFIGQHPNTDFLKDTELLMDDYGFIMTGHQLLHHPKYEVKDHTPEVLETNISGLYAAGDVRAGSTKQVASASGEGATAALLIREYLQST